MRRIAGTFVTLIVAAGVTSAAFGQAPQARRPAASAAASKAAAAKVPDPAEEAAKRAEMEKLLGLWEKQSARLTALDVGFERTDKSPGWNEKIKYQGRAYLQTPNLACLHFQKEEEKAGEKPKLVPHERIVVTGKEVLQYDYETKQIFRFPLDKQDRKKALQEGPLPFLFNMKAAEARQRYGMTLMDQNPKAYLIAIVPHDDYDREVFSKAFIQLSKTTFLPDRLMLLSPNGKDTQDYVFSGIKANGEINPQFFQALTIKGWKLIDNPAPNQAGQRPAAAGAGEAAVPPAGRPVMGQRPVRQPQQRN
jgi:TIGR03009 family protein